MPVRQTVWMLLFLCFATPWGAIAADDPPSSGTLPEKADPIKAKLDKAIENERKNIKSWEEQRAYQETKAGNLQAELDRALDVTYVQCCSDAKMKLLNFKRKLEGKRTIGNPKKIAAELKATNDKIKQLTIDIAKSKNRLASLLQQAE